MLANHQGRILTSEDEHSICDSCGNETIHEKPTKPEPSVVVILMAGIGGMLAFFGLSFGLVAAIADPSFLIICLVACAIAISLFLIAFAARRKQIGEWEKVEKLAVSSAQCDYCGFQNLRGAQKCETCGAPLKVLM